MKKEEIYKKYKKNLDDTLLKFSKYNNCEIKLYSKKDEFILCPLCFQDFEIGELTKEHAPQNSIGGKVICLTCNDCNNYIGGSKLDSHILNTLESEKIDTDFLSKFTDKENSDRFKHRLKINGNITTDLSYDKDMFIFNIDSKNSNPKSIENIKYEFLKNGKVNFNVSNPKKKNYNKVNLAFLKTAYLLFFEKFGYSLYFYEPYKRIIEQIHNPDRDIINNFNFIFNEKLDNNFLGINAIYKKNTTNILAWVVLFPIIFEDKKDNIGVILPSIDDNNFIKYKDIFKGGEFEITKFEFISLEDPFILGKPIKKRIIYLLINTTK